METLTMYSIKHLLFGTKTGLPKAISVDRSGSERPYHVCFVLMVSVLLLVQVDDAVSTEADQTVVNLSAAKMDEVGYQRRT